MDLAALEQAVQVYFKRGLAASTTRSYESAQRRYLDFCSVAKITPIPVSQYAACLFVAFLAQQGLRPQSIQVYLAAVRHLQISEGLGGPPRAEWPQLQYVVRGVKRTRAGDPVRSRLPITPAVLKLIKAVCMAAPPEKRFEHTLLWAVSCTAFFGFLRSGEVTARPGEIPVISASGVAVDSHENISSVKLSLHHSKTDQFGKGVNIFLQKTGTDLCPVAALLQYLEVRPRGSPGALFVHRNGTPLSRERLVGMVREALRAANVDQSHYSGHSFRIGAATTAAKAGVPDYLIKALGRWESSAYQTYIRIPPESLAAVSLALGRAS